MTFSCMMEKDSQSPEPKIFYLTDKLLLHNMATSSGLRENVIPSNFFLKMFTFIILLLLLLGSTDVKCSQTDGIALRYRCYDLIYYTKTVLPVEKLRHIQGRQTPH